MEKLWALIGPVVIVVAVAWLYRYLTQESVPTVYWQGSAIALGIIYLPLALRRLS